jgi:hypothetical protein
LKVERKVFSFVTAQVGRPGGSKKAGKKDFFFEKKQQKTFDCFGCGPSG